MVGPVVRRVKAKLNGDSVFAREGDRSRTVAPRRIPGAGGQV